ncbi:hypothetical protein EBBID32_17290 [Sphingobium indicum BiD32]|uniref:Uncharacterized protein n=1 Tax=Sphingobium indicum BiD32 TaxID=1301087 RepID=N1MJK7_9SPHN|nr:hypothetical protein EBBID32_17290 [Sphingobium indicum BiD32]
MENDRAQVHHVDCAENIVNRLAEDPFDMAPRFWAGEAL